MRNTRDTFLHYLADNLPGVTVHNVRFSKDDMTQRELRNNAVNVKFMDGDNSTHRESELDVALDITFDDELAATDVVEQVTRLLQQSGCIQKKQYDANDNELGDAPGRIFWDTDISFSTVVEDTYYHATALLTLNHLF